MAFSGRRSISEFGPHYFKTPQFRWNALVYCSSYITVNVVTTVSQNQMFHTSTFECIFVNEHGIFNRAVVQRRGGEPNATRASVILCSGQLHRHRQRQGLRENVWLRGGAQNACGELRTVDDTRYSLVSSHLCTSARAFGSSAGVLSKYLRIRMRNRVARRASSYASWSLVGWLNFQRSACEHTPN